MTTTTTTLSPPLTTRIDRVRLYHRGARVTRVLSARSPKAHHSAPHYAIRVVGLPLSLRDESVRLAVTSHRHEWSVSSVRVALHVPPHEGLVESPDEEALRAAHRERLALEARLKLFKEERQALLAMRPPERPEPKPHEPPPASPLAARLALEAFITSGARQRTEQIDEALAALRRVDEQIVALEHALAQASDATKVRGHELSKTITAQVTRARGTSEEIDLELSYLIEGARWTPHYTCFISQDGQLATIQMRALIAQRSGEDWRDVELELSTADPLSWTKLPKLDSVRIGRAQPEPPSPIGFRPAPLGALSLFAVYDEALAASQALLDAPRPVPGALKAATRGIDQAHAHVSATPDDSNKGARAASFGAVPSPEMDLTPSVSRAIPRLRAPSSKEKKVVTQSSEEAIPFSSLRLGPFEQAEGGEVPRGMLRPITKWDRYVESLTESGLEIDTALGEVLEAARERARSVDELALPPERR